MVVSEAMRSVALRRNLTRALIATALLWMLTTSGCVSVRPVETGVNFSLAPDEGILVVDIHSVMPIEELSFSQAVAVSDLPAGEHFILLAVSAGKYRWDEIVIPAGEVVIPIGMSRDDSWKFRVEPGRISYPGHMEVRGRTAARSVKLGIYIDNRSALALRKLREGFADLLERYPPIYTGLMRDDFLDYYSRAFSKPAAGGTEGNSP
jgi:hypothetical protein